MMYRVWLMSAIACLRQLMLCVLPSKFGFQASARFDECNHLVTTIAREIYVLRISQVFELGVKPQSSLLLGHKNGDVAATQRARNRK